MVCYDLSGLADCADKWYMRYPLSYVWDRGPGWKVEIHDFKAGTWVMGYALFPWQLVRADWVPRWYKESLQAGEWDELVMGFLDVPRKVAADGRSGAPVADSQAEKKWPTLLEALTTQADIDGRRTNRFSLSLFIGEGVWKAILRDKQDAIACWVASKTLSGLWDVLEAALLDPEHEWRQDRFAGAEKASRTKRKT